ncbi:hypothetical protein DM02DRAFT_696062 [Periconia macrospinosa]|uniref:Zn(2)-C6 fungal-type domain-containing protein n=1 Tax=Periconia macrospinosa TaxID=97972 RepID=A0A2V1D764_9PLEO|nr:hypothetical protein DM02DRAFT_696062 [Periconia macrospinosa]
MASPAGSAEQRAVKRKSHRKSRNGCYQCKQRHTKCNETHPRCGNCVRLDIDCTWPARERYSTTYPTPPESHGTALVENHPLPNSDQSTDTFGSEMSMADLRLLHHWTAKTCDDMSPELKRCNAWRIKHVEVALDHPFLLRGLLAVAAVHKVLTDAHADKTSLLVQANDHISKALATYRQNLEQPRAETAVAMFILSTVLVIYHLATVRLEAAPEDPVNAMAHCFRLIQGVLVVVNPNLDQLTSNKVFTDMLASQVPLMEAEPIGEIIRLKRLTETKKTPAGALYIEAINQLHM